MHTHESSRRRLAACLALLLAASCGAPEAPAPVALPVVEELNAPAGELSSEPNLSASASGDIYLSWIEPDVGVSHALRYARLSPDGSWSQPVTVVTREDIFVNWADFPSLLLTRTGRLVAHWLQTSGDEAYAYDVRIAQSVDEGRTWTEGVILHDDGLQAEHGFVSLMETPAGDVQAVWLDGRNTVASAAVPETQLAFTTLSAEGAPGATQMLDTRICDCCQTASAMTSSGPVIVYRDRSADEIRDISIIRQVNGEWSKPGTVHADNWRIEGCPVNGPSVAAQGDLVAVAWFTAATGREQVWVAFSTDGGKTFASPVQVDDGNPAGRVSVALSASGEARVLWMERGDGSSADIRLRTVSQDGVRSQPVVIAETGSGRQSGFPRMAPMGDDLVVAWTGLVPPEKVHIVRVRYGK